jgi:hypothetical protein
MSKLLVGAGKAAITPTKDLFPFPGWEGANYEDIHDDYYVRVIMIDNGEKKAAIAVYELGGPPDSDETRNLIHEISGVKQENILIAATHNHSAIMLGMRPMGPDKELAKKAEAVKKIIMKGTEAAVKQALSTMRPAKYGYGTAASYINSNRDKLFEDGFWMQERNLEGFSDKTLAVLKFVDEDGKLIAALLNHGTHATSVFVTRDADGKVKVSGNFNGVACKYAEERFGNGAVVAWTSGAAGNQNPVLNGGRRYEPDGYAVMNDLPDGAAYILMEHTGQVHAVDAIRAIKEITRLSDNMPIKFLYKSTFLPAQKPPAGVDMGYNRLLVDNILSRRGIQGRPEKKLAVMEDDPENPVELKMQLALFGDIAFVGVPAEIYAEIGRDMKEASPYKKTVIVTHSDKSVGYILDKTAKDKKVFQSFGRVKPGCSDELIVENMLDLFEKALAD